MEWSYRENIKTVNSGSFCEELLSENDFWGCFSQFLLLRLWYQCFWSSYWSCMPTHTKTANIIATPMKNIFNSLLSAYWRYKPGFCFFPDINKKWVNNTDLSHTNIGLMLITSKCSPSSVYSACLRTGNTLVAFKTKP